MSVKRYISAALTAVLVFLVSRPAEAQEVKYERPSKDVEEMILAKPLPNIVFNDQMTEGVIYQQEAQYLPLSFIESIKEFRVAGLILNGDNFSQTRKTFYENVELITAATGVTRPIANLPKVLMAHDFKWSPDGRWLCFLNDTPKEIELYRVDVKVPQPAAEKINERPVNSIFGSAYEFIGNDVVIYKSVPRNIGPFPEERYPEGPIMQSSKNKKDTYKTFQNLLKSPYDEDVFEYLCTAELSLYDGTSTRTLGKQGIISAFRVSPDGSYVMYTTIHRPYTYAKPYSDFFKRVAIMDMTGKDVKVLKEPVHAPQGAPSRSSWDWRKDKPAIMSWIEHSSETDYAVKQCAYPFDIEKGAETLTTSDYKISSVIWGNDKTAIRIESSTQQKRRRVTAFDPSDPSLKNVVLIEEDTHDLGTKVNTFIGSICKSRGSGRAVIDPKGKYVLLYGDNRMEADGLKYSYIDRISLKDGQTENVWNSGTEYRMPLVDILSFSEKSLSFVVTKESATEVPNYYLVTVDKKGRVTEKKISSFVNTLPHSDRIRMEYLQYKRADGLKCAARVYLPAGYDKNRDGALPVFMWTYPHDHYTMRSAEYNFKASQNTFVIPDLTNQIFWCLKGYAVVLDWTMALVAPDKDGDYNSEFVKNLKLSAEAIVDALVEAGIGDRDRMSVGGLSYGSFMTANLLAHTDLYKCGFANSGAFNRTLTPFGFQYYDKKYWEAEQIYHDMSPYNYADKIKTPILITHGQMDENTGTHPIQSERLYYAIAGHGGDATYMQLPYEGHKMTYRENALHYFSVVEKMLDNVLLPL